MMCGSHDKQSARSIKSTNEIQGLGYRLTKYINALGLGKQNQWDTCAEGIARIEDNELSDKLDGLKEVSRNNKLKGMCDHLLST
nr:3450_t:CDS:2 [Entrophospora candida]